jgi:hypothetical protein
MSTIRYGTVTLSDLLNWLALDRIVTRPDTDPSFQVSPRFMDAILAGEPILDVVHVKSFYDVDMIIQRYDILTSVPEFFGVLKAINDRRMNAWDSGLPGPDTSLKNFPWTAQIPIVQIFD